MNELSLFAGAGGGILASYLMGCRTVCAVERDAYAAQVLAQRQNDGILRPFPIWSDITTFDGRPWRGIVDVISGGFPCQDISSAGKGAGIDGARSGLWSEMARIIGEVRPRLVFVENSPMLISRGLTRVISDLAQMVYDAHWARFSASNFGAPHQRDRLWIVANSRCQRGESRSSQTIRQQSKITERENFNNLGCIIPDSKGIRWQQTGQSEQSSYEWPSREGCQLPNPTGIGLQGQGQYWFSCDPAEDPEREAGRTFYECVGHIWGIKSRLGRVANGLAHRVDRLKAIGNGQVPIVAKSAFRYLGGDHE